MKKLKKILFSTLLLFVGLLTVHAEGEIPQTDLNVWKSVVTDMTSNIDGVNNCSILSGEGSIDLFKVGNDCVATAIKTTDDYSIVGRADSGSEKGKTYYGKITASANNMSDSNILLSELVELIYNDNSVATKRLKAYALRQSRANGATKYILKAGSSDNALYVYGGYEGKTMSGIKLNYDASTKRFTYQITQSATNEDEFYFATYFTLYFMDYLIEATPDHATALEIKGDSSKYELVKPKIEETYGAVTYPVVDSAMSIKIDVIGSGDISSKLVALYNQAKNQTTTDTQTNTGQENPNTGAFVNIFALVALLSVGTVLVLGNKRKLFKI